MLLVMVSFFSRMRSPIGSNALHCCQRYEARANDISITNSGLFNRYLRCRYSDKLISRANALLELIFISHHSFNLSGWDIQESNYMLSAICREWAVFDFHSSRLMFFFVLFHCTFMYLYLCTFLVRIKIIIIKKIIYILYIYK